MPRPVLLIAGGSRGIGAATAKLAGARGYDVAVNYKSNAKAAGDVVDAMKATGGKAVAIPGDMVSEEVVESVFDQAAKALGPITHFVHSAGIVGGAYECVWYAAAKAGVDAMVVGVAREVAKEGMRVNAVSPGVIDTISSRPA